MNKNNISFSVIDCYKRKTIFVTHSAVKAKEMLHKGFKVEVWCGQRLIQAIYNKDTELLNSYIDFFEEISTEKTKAKAKIEKHINELTTQQYKVLIGLIEHNETQAAMKGLYKILRRNNKEKV